MSGPSKRTPQAIEFAREGAALADPFTKAVILEKALPEIGERIGLPPIQFSGQRRDRLDQRKRARCCVSRQASKLGNDGKGLSPYRPRDQLPRPVAQKRLSLRPCRLEERARGVDERA